MSNTTITKIRPSARIISTIGEDLVGDTYSAIVELVKNAYDADATFVNIVFEYSEENNEPILNIEITDNGHGMSTEVVLGKWLVPATDDKLERRNSPGGRLFQGRKGIGRYAAAILGQELLLETTNKLQEQTQVLIDWNLFDTNEFLDDVEIIVESKKVTRSNGTSLYIKARQQKLYQWGRNELSKLTKELRKLKSPFANHSADSLDINLAFINCPYEEYNNEVFEIEAFPIIELFDYRICGTIDVDGKVLCKYENYSEPNLPSENIGFEIKLPSDLSYCGPVDFDFRVFDRDSEAIQNLIDKGLIDPISQRVVGKREAKELLNEVYGVNLYREGFRIRPYGNGGIDWLDLDKKRIQNPSMRLSNNQVVGFVNVKPEEISQLEEKSARDGLKENASYNGLVFMLQNVLNQLEEKRFAYRKMTGKGRFSKSVGQELNELFDYSTLAAEIRKRLSHIKAEESTVNEIVSIIQREAEVKTKLLEHIQNTIAIYQGQATLGKIVLVLLHEGRKPLNFFRQQSPNLIRWMKIYKGKGDWDDEIYEEIVERLGNFKEQTEFLSQLFLRMDPLAKQNKSERKNFPVVSAVRKAIAIFEGLMEESAITHFIECDNEISIFGWEEDLVIALTNLLENSIYWLNESDTSEKKITIEVEDSESDLIIHYKDNGPGIEKHNIESAAIFEPGFSKKTNGTGLGLPIAGEAIERLGGKILAHYNMSGAYLTIEFKK